jgi:hypothetical protein
LPSFFSYRFTRLYSLLYFIFVATLDELEHFVKVKTLFSFFLLLSVSSTVFFDSTQKLWRGGATYRTPGAATTGNNR